MEIIVEAFLYLNRLIQDNFISIHDTKSMKEELERRFQINTDDIHKIVEAYCIAKENRTKE